MTSERFNPVDFHFSWIDDGSEYGWYEWDSKRARTDARRARDARARELKAEGRTVKKTSEPNQLITRGGIGSGHPEISHVVTVYGLLIL